MKAHPYFRTVWIATNLLVCVSFLLFAYGVGSELSTRRYLRGFSDAVVPHGALPRIQVEAILEWMRHGPSRLVAEDSDSLSRRDPENTLNYDRLLAVCGTATNAFVNLAASSGLESRRLLLLDANRQAKHVVAEVFIDGRWIVVDPAYRFVYKDAQGQPLTRQQLLDPNTLREAVRPVRGYPEEYNFERTAHIRVSRIPYIGKYLRKGLDAVVPGWEEAMNWTLLMERTSFALLATSGLLLLFSVLVRFLLSWHAAKHLGIRRNRLRDRLFHVGSALFATARQT